MVCCAVFHKWQAIWVWGRGVTHYEMLILGKHDTKEVHTTEKRFTTIVLEHISMKLETVTYVILLKRYMVLPKTFSCT